MRALLKFSLVAAITLAALEIGVRARLPRPGFVPFPVAEMDGVFRSDPDRGYAYAPHLTRHVVTADYEIDFRTNERGMRGDPVDAHAPMVIRVLAVGDSYTQGHRVAEEQAWSKRLQAALPGSRVYNAGVSGYNTAQMHATAGTLLPQLRPNLLVVGPYVNGYVRMRDPFVLVGNGAGLVTRSSAERVVVVRGGILVSDFARPAAWRPDLFLKQYWYSGAYLLEVVRPAWHGLPANSAVRPAPARLEDEMEPMLRELLACQASADAAGVPMLVLLINPQETDGTYSQLQHTYNAIDSAFAAKHGMRVVDPLPQLVQLAGGRPVFRLNSDRHWSAAAHAVAADALASALAAKRQP